MAINIRVDDFNDIVKRLPTEKQARTVAMRAINRAVDAGRVAAAREVVKLYAVSQKKVNEKVTTSKASINSLEASVTWQGRPMNLADFKVLPGKPQPARRPVLRVMVSKTTGLRAYSGVFLADVRSGTRAFRRKGDARLPIEAVYGPSIPQLLGAEQVREAVTERAGEVLRVRLDHEINRMLEKL